MFYEKNLNLKKIHYKKYNYSNFSRGMNSEIDESLLPIRHSKNTYNFNYNNGALKTGLGISEAALSCNPDNPAEKKVFSYPEGVDVLGAWIFLNYDHQYSRYENIFITYCSDKSIYAGLLYSNNPTLINISSIKFDSCPTIINYNLNGLDSLIISTPENGLHFWDNVSIPSKSIDAPAITSMCIHYERLFATGALDGRSLWFSDDMNPTNWNLSLTEGGFINMMDERGVLNKVISFEDYLYVFREFGIARVMAFANQAEFSVTQLYTSSNRIYHKTIAVCGDRIMFLASDGIYSFNGITTSKLSLGIENLININNNSNALGAYYDGCYYLACTMSFPDDVKEGCEQNPTYNTNVLLEINLKSWTINILRGVDIRNLQAINDQLENSLLVCAYHDGKVRLGKVDKSGQVFGNPTTKMWKSPSTDFGAPTRKKLVKEITLISKHDITLEVVADKQTKKIPVKGNTSPQRILTNITGYLIGVNFISNQAQVEISNPQVIVGML